MTNKFHTRPVFTNAIVWAALIIATALLMSDAGDSQKTTLLLLQIAGWYTVDATLPKTGSHSRPNGPTFAGVFSEASRPGRFERASF